MLFRVPIDLAGVPQSMREREILRATIIAELDAVSLYKHSAAMSEDRDIKTVLMDMAKEEKTHIGEFQTLLLRIDAQQETELTASTKEADELTK